jgi:hypothetical protein
LIQQPLRRIHANRAPYAPGGTRRLRIGQAELSEGEGELGARSGFQIIVRSLHVWPLDSELLQCQRDQIDEGGGYIREPRLQVHESSESIGGPFLADDLGQYLEPLHQRVLISELGDYRPNVSAEVACDSRRL